MKKTYDFYRLNSGDLRVSVNQNAQIWVQYRDDCDERTWSQIDWVCTGRTALSESDVRRQLAEVFGPEI